jgi:hypothetical protein
MYLGKRLPSAGKAPLHLEVITSEGGGWFTNNFTKAFTEDSRSGMAIIKSDQNVTTDVMAQR